MSEMDDEAEKEWRSSAEYLKAINLLITRGFILIKVVRENREWETNPRVLGYEKWVNSLYALKIPPYKTKITIYILSDGTATIVSGENEEKILYEQVSLKFLDKYLEKLPMLPPELITELAGYAAEHIDEYKKIGFGR